MEMAIVERVGNLNLEEVVNQHRSLVYKIAHTFHWAIRKYPSVDLEDLISEGNCGLIQAHHNFDSAVSTNFTSYAYSYIRGFMSRFLRDKANVVKVSREVYERIGSFSRNLYADTTEKELEDKMGCTPEEAKQTVKYVYESNVIYLNQESNDDDEICPMDQLGHGDDHSSAEVDEFVSQLNSREKQILHLRQFGFTQMEIAEKLGISQPCVGRTLVKMGIKLSDFFGLELKKKKSRVR
jgi:RNA polymerase sigma factor (sigma-70 family)